MRKFVNINVVIHTKYEDLRVYWTVDIW